MIQGVLFDMDGVLFDTEKLNQELMPRLSRELGYPMSEAVFNSLLGVNNEMSRKILADAFGADYPYDEIMANSIQTFLRLAQKGELPLKKGVAECMEGLHARGLKRALVTSTAREVVESYIAGTAVLQGVFDTIVCGSEAGRSKPAPDIYLAAAARLGLDPSRCVGVEDSRNGLKSLRSAGCICAMVPDLLPFDESFHGIADYVLEDLTKLCPLIDRIDCEARVRS